MERIILVVLMVISCSGLSAAEPDYNLLVEKFVPTLSNRLDASQRHRELLKTGKKECASDEDFEVERICGVSFRDIVLKANLTDGSSEEICNGFLLPLMQEFIDCLSEECNNFFCQTDAIQTEIKNALDASGVICDNVDEIQCVEGYKPLVAILMLFGAIALFFFAFGLLFLCFRKEWCCFKGQAVVNDLKTGGNADHYATHNRARKSTCCNCTPKTCLGVFMCLTFLVLVPVFGFSIHFYTLWE